MSAVTKERREHKSRGRRSDAKWCPTLCDPDGL